MLGQIKVRRPPRISIRAYRPTARVPYALPVLWEVVSDNRYIVLASFLDLERGS